MYSSCNEPDGGGGGNWSDSESGHRQPFWERGNGDGAAGRLSFPLRLGGAARDRDRAGAVVPLRGAAFFRRICWSRRVFRAQRVPCDRGDAARARIQGVAVAGELLRSTRAPASACLLSADRAGPGSWLFSLF